jgi:hypothetical protein
MTRSNIPIFWGLKAATSHRTLLLAKSFLFCSTCSWQNTYALHADQLLVARIMSNPYDRLNPLYWSIFQLLVHVKSPLNPAACFTLRSHCYETRNSTRPRGHHHSWREAPGLLRDGARQGFGGIFQGDICPKLYVYCGVYILGIYTLCLFNICSHGRHGP